MMKIKKRCGNETCDKSLIESQIPFNRRIIRRKGEKRWVHRKRLSRLVSIVFRLLSFPTTLPNILSPSFHLLSSQNILNSQLGCLELRLYNTLNMCPKHCYSLTLLLLITLSNLFSTNQLINHSQSRYPIVNSNLTLNLNLNLIIILASNRNHLLSLFISVIMSPFKSKVQPTCGCSGQHRKLEMR